MRKLAVIIVSLMGLVAGLPAGAGAGSSARFPSEINLPDGYFPEGIAVGRGSTFYVGSLADGSIYRGDLRTGDGAVFTEPTGAFPFSTVGLDVDRHGRVWAAGAASGTGRVYDGSSGELLATYAFTAPLESLVNDVIVTADAAWFTDSGTQNCDPNIPGFCFPGSPRLFKVVLGNGGSLPHPADPDAVEEVPVDVPDLYFSNLNGIETMPGNTGLILVHNQYGGLFRFDPATGDLAVLYGPPNDPPLEGADGMSRLGRRLYVVENLAQRIAVIDLDPSTGTGALADTLPVPDAQTPTTSAIFGSAIYTVDARFATPLQGPYRIFRVAR
jgi:sugar lactone lactonase YvrE